MKKQLLLLLLIAFNFSNTFAQPSFQKTYGDIRTDVGYRVMQTTDGGYVVGGITNNAGDSTDFYLMKTDSIGDTLWTKTYGGSNDDHCVSMKQTNDGGYILVGYTSSFGLGNVDFYLVKTNANGDTLWTKTYGGTSDEGGYSVEQTFDGGYIVSGYTTSYGSGLFDFYLLKTDGAGNIIWTKTYGAFNNEQAYSVKQTSDSGYVVAGYTYSFGAGVTNIYVVRTNSIGDTLWTRTYGSTNTSVAYSVQQTSDSGFIIAGMTNIFGAGNYDAYLIKTNANGDTLWSKTYGGTDDDRAYSVQITNDGGFIIAGITKSFGAGNFDIYLIRTDSSGTLLWSRAIGGTGIEYGLFARQTNDGGYIITGSTISFGSGAEDIYLIKTDSVGSSACNDSSAATTTTSPSTIVTNPATLVSSGGSSSNPFTLVGSGGVIAALCQNIGINELSNDNSFLIYPNPSSGNFIISLNTAIKNGDIQLFNLFGEKVLEEKIYYASKKEIILKNISAGIYFVKVYDGEKYYIKKILIEQD